MVTFTTMRVVIFILIIDYYHLPGSGSLVHWKYNDMKRLINIVGAAYSGQKDPKYSNFS